MTKAILCNRNNKKTEVAISLKKQILWQVIWLETRGTFYNDKEFKPRKDIKIINVYVSSSRSPRYAKQKLTEFKGRRGNSTTIVGDFNSYHQ